MLSKDQLKVAPLSLAISLALSSAAAVAGTAIPSGQMPAGGSVVAVSSGTTVDGAGAGTNLSNPTSGTTIQLANSSSYTSSFAVVRWSQGFDIGSNATLGFTTSGSANGYVLNIDSSGNVSEIDGQLDGASNTTIFVANSNGIVVGQNAVISAPGGVALLGESMNNTAAVSDFVGNNQSGTPYLDLGSVYPSAVTIDSGATVNGASGGVLIAGGNVVNTGGIAGTQIQVVAGWVPSKTTQTINGIAGTPAYRVNTVVSSVNTPDDSYSYNSINNTTVWQPIQTGTFTLTNNGKISANATLSPYQTNEIQVYAQGGMANYGTISATGGASTNGNSAGVSVWNYSNDLNNSGAITVSSGNGGATLSMANYVSSNYIGPSLFVSTGGNLNIPSGGTISAGGRADITAGNDVSFGQTGVLEAGIVNVQAGNILGYYQADNILANGANLAVTGNINGKSGNPNASDLLGNAFGIGPLSGSDVALSVTSMGAGQSGTGVNYINIAVNGNAEVSSGDSATPLAYALSSGGYTYNNNTYSSYWNLQTNSNGNYVTPPAGLNINDGQASASYGGSFLLQASGLVTLVGSTTDGYISNPNIPNGYASDNNTYGYYSSPIFTFLGGVSIIGNQGVTVNVPIVNGWGLGGVPFNGVFLQGSQIAFNNQAFIVTSAGQMVNFNVAPLGNTYPAVFQYVYGNTLDAPSQYNSLLGSGVFINSFTTELNAFLNNPSNWTSVVNTSPVS